MVNMLACHPNSQTAQAILKEITSDQATYSAEIREAAAAHLRCLAGPAAAPDDLRMLYAGDTAVAVEEFRKRLRTADATGKAKLMEMLKSAPDRVLVGLASELSGDAAGAEMVRKARERLEAIERLGK